MAQCMLWFSLAVLFHVAFGFALPYAEIPVLFVHFLLLHIEGYLLLSALMAWLERRLDKNK